MNSFHIKNAWWSNHDKLCIAFPLKLQICHNHLESNFHSNHVTKSFTHALSPVILISFGWGWHLMNTTEIALAWSLLTKAANDKDKQLLIHSPANIQVITFYQDKWCFPQEIQQQLYQYKKLHQHQVTPPLSQGVPQPACSNEN